MTTGGSLRGPGSRAARDCSLGGMSNEALGAAMRKRLCGARTTSMSRKPASTIHSEATVFDSDRDEVWSGCGLPELRS
jgi:hypothetical protein